MNTITIIGGPNGSGKSTLALELTEGKRRQILMIYKNCINSPFCFEDVKPDTEIIILEECSVEVLKMVCSQQIIKVSRKGRERFEMPMPDIIFTTNGSFTTKDIPRRKNLRVITLTGNY